MQYHDSLYGTWELPAVIAKLVRTKTARRMRCITQSVFPNELVLHGPIPSRFQHGLGVAYLMNRALRQSDLSDDDRILLLVAAFLHDAGNPPFTHLAEPFLKKMLGFDGETFLSVILMDDPELLTILMEYRVDIKTLVDTVSGKTELSKILHGTMDVDNLDNIARYADAAHLEIPDFHPRELASGYQWHQGAWKLHSFLWPYVRLWQDARAIVYRKVYDLNGFAPEVMLHRALDLAFAQGMLTHSFFSLNDSQAIDALLESSIKEVRDVVSDMVHYRWFEPVFSVETTEPAEALKSLTELKDSRSLIANEIASAVPALARGCIAVHVEKGRDHRAVTLSLLQDTVTIDAPVQEFRPMYRFRAFVAHDTSPAERDAVREHASRLTDHQNQLT